MYSSFNITLTKYCLFKELEQWDKWEENPVVVIPDKPVNTVQAKIEQYRQQVVKPPDVPTEERLNFFEVILKLIPMYCHLNKVYTLSLNIIYIGHDSKNH